MNTNLESNYSNLSPYLYLFITDILQLKYKTYAQYAEKEPGFAHAYFSAYIHAFQAPKDGRLSHDLIKNIHRLATQHLPISIDHQPGQYRKHKGAYTLSVSATPSVAGIKTNSMYNTTLKGFDELLERWFLHPDSPRTHTLGFQGTNVDPSYTYFLGYVDHQLRWTCLNTNQSVPFEKEKHIPLMHQFLQDKENYLHCALFIMRERENIPVLAEQQMQDWMDAYHLAIESAHTEAEKLDVIVQHIQWLNNRHIFGDGNIRTCYILLNKLLSDHHLPLCILMNPNQFDGFEHEEMLRMVQEGQALYQRLLHDCKRPVNKWVVPVTLQYSICHNGTSIPLPSPFTEVTCLPVDLQEPALLQEFCQTVLNISPAKTNTTVASPIPPTVSVFGQRNQSTQDALEAKITPHLVAGGANSDKIREALLQRDYNLLWRRVCASGSFAMIRCVLAYRIALGIDLNSESSNRKTGLDWFITCTTSKKLQPEKNKLINELKDAGARMNFPEESEKNMGPAKLGL